VKNFNGYKKLKIFRWYRNRIQLEKIEMFIKRLYELMVNETQIM